jgi:hypothetical protein
VTASVAADEAGAPRAGRGDAADPERDARFERLVRELGDADYRTRRHATHALAEAGRAALPYLHKALESDDLEIRQRARMLIHRVRWRLTPELRKRLGVTLDNFLELPASHRRSRLDRLIERGGAEAASYLATIADEDPSDTHRRLARLRLQAIGRDRELARKALDALDPNGGFAERLARGHCLVTSDRSERGLELLLTLFDRVDSEEHYTGLARTWWEAVRQVRRPEPYLKILRDEIDAALEGSPPVEGSQARWALRTRCRALFEVATNGRDFELAVFVAERWLPIESEARPWALRTATELYRRAARTFRKSDLENLDGLLKAFPAKRHEEYELMYLRYLLADLRDEAEPKVLTYIAHQRPKDVNWHYEAAQFLLSLDRPGLAEGELVRTIVASGGKKERRSLRAHMKLADVLMGQGRTEEAIEALRRAGDGLGAFDGRLRRNLDVEFEESILRVAEIMYRDKKIDALRQLIDAMPDGMDDRLALLYLRYLVTLHQRRQPPEALERAIARTDGRTPRISYEVGAFLERLKENDLAMAEYRRCISLPATSSVMKGYVARARRRLKELEDKARHAEGQGE